VTIRVKSQRVKNGQEETAEYEGDRDHRRTTSRSPEVQGRLPQKHGHRRHCLLDRQRTKLAREQPPSETATTVDYS